MSVLSRRHCQPVAKCRIFDHAADRKSEAVRIVSGHEKGIDLVLENFPQGGHIGSDDRPSRCHVLESFQRGIFCRQSTSSGVGKKQHISRREVFAHTGRRDMPLDTDVAKSKLLDLTAHTFDVVWCASHEEKQNLRQFARASQ